MLGYFIVIAILGFLFVHMTMSILNWGIPEVIEDSSLRSKHSQDEHLNLSAESGIMEEILSSNEGVRTTYGTQDDAIPSGMSCNAVHYYSGDLGDEN